MEVKNVTQTPARIDRIDHTHSITGNPSNIDMVSSQGFTIPAGHSETFDIPIDLSDEQLRIYQINQLSVTAVIAVELTHPISGPFWHSYRLIMHCPMGEQPRTIIRNDRAGRPPDEDERPEQERQPQ